jgi:manganese transport system permease protein
VTSALLTAASIGLACSLLSLFVILRRWALVGEGISHSAIGGAGTAWLLALGVHGLDKPAFQYASAVGFCLLAALIIGWLSQRERVNVDAALGIFLVASLAWGFFAAHVYRSIAGREPAAWDMLLLGAGLIRDANLTLALTALSTCAAVTLVVTMMRKEILAYSFDPVMAQVQGVPSRFVHYLLLMMVAVVTIVGMRVAGSVLVPALLVLPGAAALRLSDRLTTCLLISLVVGVVGSVGGVLVSARWPIVPEGPAIVLLLLACFVGTLIFRRPGR